MGLADLLTNNAREDLVHGLLEWLSIYPFMPFTICSWNICSEGSVLLKSEADAGGLEMWDPDIFQERNNGPSDLSHLKTTTVEALLGPG